MQKHVYWVGHNEEVIRGVWERQAKNRLSDYINKKKMLKGCRKEVLQDILKYWDSSYVKAKSKRNSTNRNKGPKATWYGGRKSTTSWKKTLEKQKKKSDPFAVFEHTHKDHDGKTFTNPKANGLHDKYVEIHTRDSQPLPGTQEPRTVDPNKTYLEAMGSPSHGRFFGLGVKAGK